MLERRRRKPVVEAHNADLKLRIGRPRHPDVPALALETDDEIEEIRMDAPRLLDPFGANARKQPRGSDAVYRAPFQPNALSRRAG